MGGGKLSPFLFGLRFFSLTQVVFLLEINFAPSLPLRTQPQLNQAIQVAKISFHSFPTII